MPERQSATLDVSSGFDDDSKLCTSASYLADVSASTFVGRTLLSLQHSQHARLQRDRAEENWLRFALRRELYNHARIFSSSHYNKAKWKGWPSPMVSLGRCSSPLHGPWAVDTSQSLWHMANASPDLRSPSQPQSVTVLWPVPSYTAWWQRHTGVRSLPKATAQWCRGRTQTCDL